MNNKLINLNIPVGFSGHITVQKWSVKRKTFYEASFDNVVLEVGLEEIRNRFPNNDPATGQIVTASMRPTHMYLGTSGIEPSINDPGLLAVSTSLGGKAVTSTTFTGSFARLPGQFWSGIRRQHDWGEGEAAGTWLELGLAWGASSYTLPFNRALFRDENGVPTPLTVLSDEFLRIFIELRAHFPHQNPLQSGSFLLNGDTTINWNAFVSTGIGSTSSSSTTFHNFWTHGFGTHAKYNSGESGTSSSSYCSRTYDFENLEVNGSIFIPKTIGSTVNVGLLTFGRADVLSRGHSVAIVLNPVLSKPDIATLEGTWGVRWTVGQYVPPE
jgi:hypothetical protein